MIVQSFLLEGERKTPGKYSIINRHNKHIWIDYMNSQGKTVPSPIDWGNILDLLKPGNPQDPEIWATIRMKRAFDRISVHAQQNRGNNEQLDELNKLLEVITGQSKELAAKYPKEWENLGLKLCAVSGRFVNFFPSISKERKRWTLLDYLQNDIIRFYHFLDEHKINRRAAARKVMVFLLAHRNDDETALAKAVRQLQETECDSTLLRYFRSTLDSYQKSASSASIPERAHDFLAVTSNVTMKVKKESDMITVGSKPEGNAPGRLKVKRIRATAGKALSEPDKYLNLWLEKDLDNAPVEYKEPSGGVLAQALYPSGTPKPRLLQQTKDEKKTDIFHFSSINKFRNNLIHFGDIEKNPLYKIEDLEEKPVKLLGKPVTGLISMLITSCWFLRNEDFHGRNFGVVIEDGKTRFFIFDFDNIRFFEIILSEVKNEFLAAFNEGDMASLRERLKEEFLKSHIANSGQPYTPLLFKLIDQYSDEQIIEEL